MAAETESFKGDGTLCGMRFKESSKGNGALCGMRLQEGADAKLQRMAPREPWKV